MVAGFAAGGLVDLVPALAVMLGANVGTTLIVQLLSLNLSSATPALILLGVLMFRRGQASRTHDLGRVAIGLGLMLMALHQLLDLVTPFEDAPSLRLLLGAIATQPWLDVVIAAGLTWAAHSRGDRVAGDVARRERRGAARTQPSRWCSAPISAPRSTHCWKGREGRTPQLAACRPAIWARALSVWRSG